MAFHPSLISVPLCSLIRACVCRACQFGKFKHLKESQLGDSVPSDRAWSLIRALIYFGIP